MTNRAASARPGIARIACHRGLSVAGSSGYRRDFAANEKVRSATQVRNDGTYPHKDIGEILVREGDVGFVHESWSFLGEVYYTVEFAERAVVVIMRGREMAKHDCKAALAQAACGTKKAESASRYLEPLRENAHDDRCCRSDR